LVRHGESYLTLDNMLKVVVDANRIKHYRVVYSLNENESWRHWQ
jgi:hypothetical protein